MHFAYLLCALHLGFTMDHMWAALDINIVVHVNFTLVTYSRKSTGVAKTINDSLLHLGVSVSQASEPAFTIAGLYTWDI